MRIIKPDAKFIILERPGKRLRRFNIEDTIEITDNEWDEIWIEYERESTGQGFAKYLHELIELRRCK